MTELTSAEIISGAIDLIDKNGYTIFGVEGGRYSIPAAFDEIVFGDANYSSGILDRRLLSVDDYPPAYNEAREAAGKHWNNFSLGVPFTKKEAIDSLRSALNEIQKGSAAA